jgi:hypothetical protein
MNRNQTQRQHRWPKGGQQSHPVLNAIRKLKSLWKGKPRAPSFHIIRIERMPSATAPVMVRRKPLPSTPEASTLAAPAACQRGLVVNNQGEWEYRSMYRIGMAGPGQPRQVGRGTEAQGLDLLAPAKTYIPFRPCTNIHPPPNVPRGSRASPVNLVYEETNADERNTGGRPTPKCADTDPVGTPLRPSLVPELVTLPKAEYGHPITGVPVSNAWRGNSRPGLVIAERQRTAPCDLPLIVVTPASTNSSEPALPDDRRTLPSQRWRQGRAPDLKIVTPKMRPVGARQEPQVAPRPQPMLRKRPGFRSLKQAALAHLKNDGHDFGAAGNTVW